MYRDKGKENGNHYFMALGKSMIEIPCASCSRRFSNSVVEVDFLILDVRIMGLLPQLYWKSQQLQLKT